MKYMALCDSRHPIPDAVDGAVFPNTINPLAVEELEQMAKSALVNTDSLTLFVTGLSVALVAVINVCHANNIILTLMHYDRDTGTYYPQKVK